MLWIWTKKMYMCDNKLVLKAVRLAFSCQTSAISLPFILIPWFKLIRKYAVLLTLRRVSLECTQILFITLKLGLISFLKNYKKLVYNDYYENESDSQFSRYVCRKTKRRLWRQFREHSPLPLNGSVCEKMKGGIGLRRKISAFDRY